MKDKKGKEKSQCIIFVIAIVIMTIAMVIAAEVENYPECIYGSAENVCRAFVCTVENKCSCDESDFATDYAYGVIQHSRPYRCDPTDKDRGPYKTGNILAFVTGILAIFAIGWVEQYHNHKCDCEGQCHGCGCMVASRCTCPSDCPTCCAPSRFGMKTVCGCDGCKRRMRSGTSKVTLDNHCLCRGCVGTECTCNSRDGKGTNCLYPIPVVIERARKGD
jgi:hypothetical protein